MSAWPAGRATLLVTLAIALATITLGPLSRAEWAIHDDHEIALFAGRAGRLPVSMIPEALSQTEVGHAGRTARFRPSYFALRLVESSAWGLNPAGWYRTRLVLCVMSVFIVGWLLAPHIGTLATIGVLVWVLSARYWLHVWGRLGTAESYAAFGFALWGLGIHLLWSGASTSARYRRALGLVAFVIGNAVVAGAKENLLVIAAPNAILALVEMRNGRIGGYRWWSCVGNVAVAVAVAAPLISYFTAKPVDLYGRSVAVEQQFALLGRGMTRLTFVHLAFLATLTLWVGSRLLALFGLAQIGQPWHRLTSRLVLLATGALALFLSQFVLYNGDITPDTHYEFPAALAGPALVVAVSLCLRGFFCRIGDASAERAVYYATTVLVVCAALAVMPGLREQRAISHGWAVATRDFTARVKAAAETARADATVPIVIVSGRPLDLEPIVSVERFLRVLGATNPKLVLLDWASLRPQWTPLENYLAPEVQRIAEDRSVGLAPASTFDPTAPCFSIGLSHEPRPGCRSLGRLW